MHASASRARRAMLALIAALAAVVAFVASAVPANAMDRHPDNRSETEQLAALARTTAPFHNVENALAAGWLEQPTCVDYPNGYMGEGPGAMGHHFPNVDYLNDGGRLDPTEPELLVYEKRATGTWRLNAVEYIIPARDLPPTAEPPTMFGGHELVFHPEIGQAGIWGVHVWLWRHNPHGMYAEVNPRVSCEHSAGGHHS